LWPVFEGIGAGAYDIEPEPSSNRMTEKPSAVGRLDGAATSGAAASPISGAERAQA
jgi:hypothetical protein